MNSQWNQPAIQKYIDDEIEEDLNLDYKAAEALGKTDGKKKEITKDVSAMANSNGGIIIYGVKEYQDDDHKHLPETIDHIDQKTFSKEWLEHVISNIQPRIDGLKIFPIPIPNRLNCVVYVVDIPQSTTAHQAKDYRYYKRFNFESAPMVDYEIRDVMNRSKVADVEVTFDYHSLEARTDIHQYWLSIKITNLGVKVVNNYKLNFTFPAFGILKPHSTLDDDILLHTGVNIKSISNKYLSVNFQSSDILFPEETIEAGEKIRLEYSIDEATYSMLDNSNNHDLTLLKWILYADDMPPKRGEIPLSALNNY